MKKIIKAIVFLILAAVCFGVISINGMWDGRLPGMSLSIDRLLECGLIVFGVLFLENLIVFILGRVKTASHRSKTVISLTCNVLRYAAAIAIICGVISALCEDVAAVIAGLGVIALIIGFGAESLISDVVTGAFILIDNQYNVGDIIEVNGFRGTVSEIGVRTTSVTDTGGNVKIINNSDMKNILNRSDNMSKAVADFPIPYETDLAKLEEKIPAMLEEIYKAHTDSMKSCPKYLGVQELGDSAVVLRFVADVGEKDIYSAGRILNRELLLKMRAAGVECPFTQIDVHSR